MYDFTTEVQDDLKEHFANNKDSKLKADHQYRPSFEQNTAVFPLKKHSFFHYFLPKTL